MSTFFSLVRHGAYPLVNRALGGRGPYPLSDEGRAQAARIAGAFRGRPIAAVVSSPVRRAVETAEPIAAALGLEVVPDPDFTEIDFGAWTGRPFDTLRAEPGWREWNEFRSTARIPGGETILSVQARMVAGLVRLRDAFPDAELVVVSHADPIKAMLCHFLGMPLDLIRRIEVAPGSVSRIVLHDADAAVLGINLPA